MVNWSFKLFGLLLALSSVCPIHASHEEFDGSLFRSSSFAWIGQGQAWGLNDGFEAILGGGSNPFGNLLSAPLDENPTVPSNTDAHQEPRPVVLENDVEVVSQSALSKVVEANIRRALIQAKTRRSYIFRLLHTLQEKGACEYDLLREEVLDEGKRIYTLCSDCLKLGLVKSPKIGIWEITEMGRFGLKELERMGEELSPRPDPKKRALEEDDVEEDEDEEAAADIAWPKEFYRIRKPKRYLGVLKALADEEEHTVAEIRRFISENPKYGADEHTLERLANYLEVPLQRGWIKRGSSNGMYFLTVGGLKILKEIDDEQPVEDEDRVKTLSKEPKAKKRVTFWPEEFKNFHKPEMHLALLKILEDREGLSASLIRIRYEKATGLVLDQVTNNLKTHVKRGWINRDHANIYRITNEGLRVLHQVEYEDVPEVEVVEQIQEFRKVFSLSPSKLRAKTNLRRTRSLNDMEEVGREPLTPMPSPSKRHKPDSEEGPDIMDEDPQVQQESYPEEEGGSSSEPIEASLPVRLGWEDLPEELRGFLLQKLNSITIPGVLADERLMRIVLKGNFIENLRKAVGMQFVYQTGMNIDHILEQYLHQHIKISLVGK